MENDRNLDSLLDQLALDCKPGDWHARPVLSESQWAVFHGLVSHLEDDEHVVLACCALSAFFDPTRHEAGHAHDVKRMSALFAIAHGRGKINAKPLLFITDDESDASGATEFLQVWGAPVLRFEPLLAPRDFVEKSIALLNTGRNYSGDRRPINAVESKVAFHLKAATPHVFLHEVAVQRMIPEIVLARSPGLVESIRSLGPVDIVIHSQDSNTPLLCIEVDGQTHTAERRQIQDNRKTTLLRTIGLPVLRILPSDIRLWQKSWSKEFYLYVKIISHWANQIANGMQESLAQDIEDHHFQREFLNLREQLSNATFGAEYRSLSTDQEISIDRSTLLKDLNEDKYYSDIVRAGPPSLDQPDSLSELTEPPPRLSRHVGRARIRGSILTGVSAEAAFKAQGVAEILQSSTFYLSHPYLTEAESYRQLTNLALRHLYWQADQKVAEHRR